VDNIFRLASETVTQYNVEDSDELKSARDTGKDSVGEDNDELKSSDEFDDDDLSRTLSETYGIVQQTIEDFKWLSKASKSKGVKEGDITLNWYHMNESMEELVDYIAAYKQFFLIKDGSSIELERIADEDEGLDRKDLFKTWRKIAGICNTKIGREYVATPAEFLKSNEPQERYYLFEDARNGDRHLKECSWFHIVAWQSQKRSDDGTTILRDAVSFVQHDQIRVGDMVAIDLRIALPMISDCEIRTISADNACTVKQQNEDEGEEFEVDEESMYGELFITTIEKERRQRRNDIISKYIKQCIGPVDSWAQAAQRAGIPYRRKIIQRDDGAFDGESDFVFSWAADPIGKVVFHSWAKPPLKLKKPLHVKYLDIDELQSESFKKDYLSCIIAQYTYMVNERNVSNSFKILTGGKLKYKLPTEAQQKKFVVPAHTPFYFELFYGENNKKMNNELIMLTSSNNFERREWMKALKAVTYDEAKLRALTKRYQKSLNDDPSLAAAMKGNITRAGALEIAVKERRRKFRTCVRVQDSKGQASLKSAFEDLSELLRPEPVHGKPGQVEFLGLVREKAPARYAAALEAVSDDDLAALEALTAATSLSEASQLVEAAAEKWQLYVDKQLASTDPSSYVVRVKKAHRMIEELFQKEIAETKKEIAEEKKRKRNKRATDSAVK